VGESLGILVFGLITLGVPLLLVALPSVLLVFARGVRPSFKALWVFLSLLPVVTMVAARHHALPMAFFVFPSWAVYLFYLWLGRGSSKRIRPGRHRMGLGLATTAFLCFVAWSGLDVHRSLKESASTHDVFWPMDSLGTRYVRLRLPARFGGNWLQPADSTSPAMPVGPPDRKGEISTALLWPTLETRVYDNEAEFEGFAPHVLTVDFKVLNRFSSDERPVNQLACNFELATNNMGKDCFVAPPTSAISPPLASLAPRYGLRRKGSEAPVKQGGPFPRDVWFVLADDGVVQTMIECPREGEASIHAECKQSFEVQPLNAIVEVRFNREYLPQWKDIQVALTKLLLTMRL